MHTLAQLSKALNRSNVEISGLQSRFELPVIVGAGYSMAYLAFLETLVNLRALAVSEEKLRELWVVEKKLLQLLHVDSTGSPTWFLDSCGASSNPKRCLLLSNYEMGAEIDGGSIQLGLDFAKTPPELFPAEMMGVDALRLLDDYRRLERGIRSQVKSELSRVRAAVKWAVKRLG
jgi:hypothetical protein